MTQMEELARCEEKKEENLRCIRAKIAHATARELDLIWAFIQGLGVVGWDDAEYHRPIQKKEQEAAV